MLVVTGVMTGRQCLLNQEHLVVLLAGLFPHNSICSLIFTADLSHFANLLDMLFSGLRYFLLVLSLENSVC